MNPRSAVSEMKFTMPPARTKRATNASAATNTAVPAASTPNRAGSPPVMAPSEEPTSSEIAEVTVTEVCRELVNNQNTRPEKIHA